MANPRKITRPFRAPGDVERMWQRLARSGPSWDEASLADKVAFLQAMAPAYAAYDRFHVLSAGQISASQFTFINPFTSGAGLNTNPTGGGGGVPEERFWSSPVFAENARTPNAKPSSEFLSGWYFLPKDITLRFYNNGTYAVKNGNFCEVRSRNIDSGPNLPPVSNATESQGIIGLAASGQTKRWQVFSTHGGSANEAAAANVNQIIPGWLRDFPLLPNANLTFNGLTGLVANDIVRVTITGEWHFSPYYMEPGEEPDR